MDVTPDFIVIGAGPRGYVTAIRGKFSTVWVFIVQEFHRAQPIRLTLDLKLTFR